MAAQKRIAIISEDVILRSQLKNYLSDIGHSIEVVHNYGDELNSVVENFAPDLLIVDPEAPELSGLEIGLQLRRRSETPILMLSGFRTPKNQIRMLDTRSRDFLGRPFGFPDLAERIEQILSMEGSDDEEIDIFGS